MAQRPYAMEFYKNPDRNEGTCPVCNLSYVKSLESDRKFHRAFHRRIVDVFEPKPSHALMKLYAAHGRYIPIQPNTPIYLRKRLANIARVFQREFGSDFAPYEEHRDLGHGYLITEPDGRAIGGSTVRWIEYKNAPAQWVFMWIWVAPGFRRRGLLQATWEMVRATFPGIDPHPPFSKPAATFFAGRTDVSDRIREYAKRQLAADSF